MINKKIAKIFKEIAEYLEMEDVQFKPQAYRKAAFLIDNLDQNLNEIYQEGGEKALKGLSGIGESIADKIIEYIKTGKIEYYEKYKKKVPIEFDELTSVEGIGPKTVKKLWKELDIKDLESLEKAAKDKKIRELDGFGEKSEKNILEGIEFVKSSKGRFLLGDILPVVEEIKEKLKNLEQVKKVDVCGSVRRKKATIGDIDFLVLTDNPEPVMEFFVSMPNVVKVWGKGKTKSSIRTEQDFDIDLRVIPKKSYGAALQYFTGSKDHNIKTRKIAINKRLKLSEYGVFKKEKRIAGKTEKEVYNAIGLPFIEPELRTDSGEIKAAKEDKLPKLVKLEDIKGDLHLHSNWNGGDNSIEEIAKAAKELGYNYIGISDHTKTLKIENGLNEKQLEEQRKEIKKLNKKLKGITILQGAETNILKDGSIDIKDNALKKLDYAIAGIHSHFKMREKEMTERIIKAMSNPNINIISHPTGRILKRRDQYKIDLDKLFKFAKKTNTVLEIDSFKKRLDLKDVNIRKAKEAGVKMVIDSDAHNIIHLKYMELGVFQARRGWAEKKDIVNTLSLKKLVKLFK